MTSIATAGGRLEQIGDALAAAPEGDFAAAAGRLLAALGYRSERILTGQSGAAAELVASNADTRSKSDFIAAARSARVLFQVTDAEISGAAQEALFADRDFADFTDFADPQSSFIFAVVELKDASYPRGRYAAFTREINKRFQAPAVVLFRTASGRLTLAFVHRRENRRDPQRDALGSVFLLREIDPARPHRAHLEILGELALPQRLDWLRRQGRAANFAGLLAAWLDALDTEELNRRFYRELFGWFERAVAAAKFPAGRDGSIPKEEQVIRLITRLLFVWFIKEKGLIAADLFVEHQVTGLLKDYDREQGDSYYRAVLQNLFFATLNTEIRRRGFSSGNNNTHRDFSLYRYESEIADAGRLLQLFAQTPFINGGLFDCLDSAAAAGAGGYRVDCFTDNALRPGRAEHGILSVPNRLFFAGESRREREPGLIDLFNRYKFTVEENTPAEQEVALDPELLGKVFENLLAAYNPETRETARKQTGSYYTPRAVVDYMVEEALVAALAEKLAAVAGEKEGAADRESRLRWLLDYADAYADDAGTLFSDGERAAIVAAIAQLKVLDPAVGSGAFPMGILHKLTLALRRLDGDNALWGELQRGEARERLDKALDTAEREQRNQELTEISNTFEHYRASDFGRKLYLIQNSVFGVDRQTVACQIAKLRFFISLAIEQEPTADPADNYGIRPLPNLETRFVAADTLRGLGGLNRQLVSPETERLYQQLAENRERHFHATIRADKLRCRRADERLRGQLAASLRTAGLAADHADKVAQWDPYDQNAAADWFDPGYMFGVRDGFDVVIGNPPYVQLQREGSRLANLYKDAGFATFARTGDIYQLFYEKGGQLLKPGSGLLAYITSNSWLKAEYGKATRRWFAENHTPLKLLEMGKDVFENVIVDAGILLARQGKSGAVAIAVDTDKLADKTFPPAPELWSELRPEGEKPWSALSALERSVMDKMESVGTPLKDWDVSIDYGVKTGYNSAFIVDDATKEALIAADPESADILKPVLQGKDIRRWQAQWAGRWLINARKGIAIDTYPAVYSHLQQYQDRLSKKAGVNEWYELQASPSDRLNALFQEEKLVWIELVERGRFAWDDTGIYGEASTFIMTGENLKYLCAVLNSSLITWCLGQIAPTSGMGTLRWKKAYVERIPIPQISAAEQAPLVALVERILAAKAGDLPADTGDLERELDGLVYGLYGLTGEEVGVGVGG